MRVSLSKGRTPVSSDIRFLVFFFPGLPQTKAHGSTTTGLEACNVLLLVPFRVSLCGVLFIDTRNQVTVCMYSVFPCDNRLTGSCRITGMEKLIVIEARRQRKVKRDLVRT